MSKAYISIGSNIEPQKNIPLALEELQKKCEVKNISSIYYTKPYGYEPQENFHNLVVEIITSLDPFDLLENLQQIEKHLQRVRLISNGPRTIDLDILLYEQQVIETPDLIVPHPGLLERDFMLTPLLEIYPSFSHPVHGTNFGQIKYHCIIGKKDE